MIRRALLPLCCLLLSQTLAVGQSSSQRQSWFVSAQGNAGTVMQSNSFVNGPRQIPFYRSTALKAGVAVREGSPLDRIYGHPYFGLGFYHAEFFRDADLGSPWSVYLLQGATPWRIAPWLGAGYELNLGLSWGWVPYNIKVKPQNIAIGSHVDVLFSVNAYLRWLLSRRLSMLTGASFTHFSNGDTHLPNNGINAISGFATLNYAFDAGRALLHDDSPKFTEPPARRFVHDLTISTSVRGVKLDTLGTGLSLRYYNNRLQVWNVSYSLLRVAGWRYLWGPSVEMTYDESAGARGWTEPDPVTGAPVDRFALAPLADRLTLGLSLKGEMEMPYYSAFVQVGYDVARSRVNHPEEPARLYQILGLRFFPYKGLFCTFAIRATRFQSAQYFLLGAGWRFGTRG